MIASLPNLRLGYDVAGSGPPALLIMGLAVNRGGWELQVERWRQTHTCITFDNRGIGESDTPPGRYSTDQMADDAAALLQLLGVDRAEVVGISMGGMIAQKLALRAPKRVRSLTLLATHGGGLASTPPAATVAHYVAMQAARSPDARFKHFAKLLFSDRFLEDNHPTLRHRMMTGPLKDPQSMRGFRGQFAAVSGHRTGRALRALAGTPTLLMHGTADACVRPLNVRLLKSWMPWAHTSVLDRVGHGINVEAADAVNDTVSRFWAGK